MKKYLDNSVLVPELGRLVGEGRAVTVMVRGNSMLPFLADGRDAVTLRRYWPADCRCIIESLWQEKYLAIQPFFIVYKADSVFLPIFVTT